MTGVADIYLMISKPQSKEARQRFAALLQKRKKPGDLQKFVVLSWKRSGSNLLCGILHSHPEIIMHNELFNPIDIFTYYPAALLRDESQNHQKWNFLSRDLWPRIFLDHIWRGCFADDTKIKQKGKAIGFKSFPDHWKDADNEDIWKEDILDDLGVKKIILSRECELSTYVSMKRAEITGSYLGKAYPQELKVHIGIPEFQAFVNHYRFTFQRKYRSPLYKQDSFHITYEQLIDEKVFDNEIAPKLWAFLGVDDDFPVQRLKEIVKQSPDNEQLEDVISNWDQLEQAFRYSDISFFRNRRKVTTIYPGDRTSTLATGHLTINHLSLSSDGTWSILLPICSRIASAVTVPKVSQEDKYTDRFATLERHSTYTLDNIESSDICWKRLSTFAESLSDTTSAEDRKRIECIVGIDKDDKVFNTDDAKDRLRDILPCKVKFVSIPPKMYGKVCRIWNCLGQQAANDFIVLLGDDVVLLDKGWKSIIEKQFKRIHSKNPILPFGAACVAFNDVSFKGFPTFPVVHRFHLDTFGFLLPRQFVNQGGDPFLYGLYSRFNAAAFAPVKLKNTLGGDSSARYLKHDINWKGQVLKLAILNLSKKLDDAKPVGVCLDVVVPSYRTKNKEILGKIVALRSTSCAYVKFWIVVDNPDKQHLAEVKMLADRNNSDLQNQNYFVNVVHYDENRGASYARNTGYNYSSADWVVFLDDDIVPEPQLLDSYIGSIARYPNAKVMVGLTELPTPCNTWTSMLKTSNVMYFYSISKHRIHPPWGVTANIMVKGSRHNHKVQFKHLYPKTGGGEDIDFVFQMKKFHKQDGTVVAVPEARVKHPWWNSGDVCYKQICGWANGDSQVITEWPEKTYLVFPNWIESISLLVAIQCSPLCGAFYMIPMLKTCIFIAIIDHLIKVLAYYTSAAKVSASAKSKLPFLYTLFLAFGASTVISAQEITRTICILKRLTLFSFGRRMDWFDGQAQMEILDQKLRSALQFIVYCAVAHHFIQTSM